MIQKIGDDDKDRLIALRGAEVANGGCQVGLAAAIRPGDHQPTPGLLGILLGDPKCFLQALLLVGWKFLVLAQAEIPKGVTGEQRQGADPPGGGIRGGIAVIGRGDLHRSDQFAILQPRAHPPIELDQVEIGGDDGRELLDIAVIDDLVELLLRPGGGVLGTEVIQHQQADIPDLLETALKRGFRGIVGRPQPVQQVWHSEEEGGHTETDHEIRHRGRKVGLAASIAASEQQPARQVLRVLTRLIEGQLQGVFLRFAKPKPSAGIEVFEGHIPEGIQVAQAVEPGEILLLAGAFAALAQLQPAKIGF